MKPPRRPTFWIESDDARRVSSATADLFTEESGVESTPLLVRFRWDAKAAEVWWEKPTTSPLRERLARSEMQH